MNQNEKQTENEDVTMCILGFQHFGKCFSSPLVPLPHRRKRADWSSKHFNLTSSLC